MDNPPQAHRFVQAVKAPLAPAPTPPACRSAFPGIAGVPPAPAGGRQWTTRRRPTGLSKRSRRPSRPRRPLHLAGVPPFLGSRASRPPRPEAGNGQPAEGPPACPSGQGAPRARADTSSLPERLSWDRGRPARPRPEAGNGQPAEGPPACPSGQGAPRARAGPSILPECRLSWDRGRPARPGRRPAMDNPPQAHRFDQAVKAHFAPTPTPQACRSAFPGIAGVPPAPAGGR